MHHKISEAVGSRPNGNDDAVKLRNGLYVHKGPEFHEKFMAEYAMPRRYEMATMAMASHIQRVGIPNKEDVGQVVEQAWAIADEFILSERKTLDPLMLRYFELYMKQNKQTDEVIKALVESQHDFSL